MGRARHGKTLQRMNAIREIAEGRQPITVRGIAYALFIRGMTDSMATRNTQMVSRLVTQMREEGSLPWEWIVDNGRPVCATPSWDDPEAFMDSVLSQYRKDYWSHQPYDVRLWSEKATVAGTLAPVRKRYGVPFQFLKGFNSATEAYKAAQSNFHSSSRYESILLYIGDHDPSGLYMSEVDLPGRLERYGGQAVIQRIALTSDDGPALDLPSFPVEDKRTDPRFKWWEQNGFGPRCWELDAMDPNLLRLRVEQAILEYIDLIAWKRCEVTEQAESASMQEFFRSYPILGQVSK
jgi:hypothetical protein